MPGDIDDLAGALADGDDIDWKAAQDRQQSPDSRGVVAGLESLSHLSSLTPGPARPSRRLPWLLEVARLLSVVFCVAGVAGFARSFERRDGVVLAVLVTFAGIAAFLDVAGRDSRTRGLAACFWTTAGAFAARGALKFTGAWDPVAALVAVRPDAFFALAVWQFARHFPSVTRFGSVDVVCAWGVRVSGAIGACFFAVSTLPLLMPRSQAAAALTPQRYGSGPSTVLFSFLVFGAALAAFAVIAWRSRLAEGAERTRVRIFLSAIVVAFAPIMTLVVVVSLMPRLLRTFQTPDGFVRTAWIVYPPMFLVPVATAYAVAARDVLNVRLVVQRGLRYLLARWLLMWGALVPVALLLGHLYRHADLTLGGALATEPAPVLLWFAGVGAIVLAFRGTLIRALDQWALPGVEEPAAALAAMTERMKQARTPLEVSVTLADAIERAMQARATAYLFMGGAIVPAEGGDPALPIESAIPALMEGAREPANVSAAQRRSYYSLLLHSDREWIDRHHIELLVPLLPGRPGSGLLGLVTVSARRNALGFSEDDIRFVRVAAAAASLACDANASEGRRQGQPADDTPEEVALQCVRCRRVEDRHAGAGVCACGGAWEAAALPKRVLDRFELLEWLGAGGMGVVYRALDVGLKRDVALKTLPQLSDQAAERLMAEARTMASLSYEDVAVVYGVEQWRGTPLLVMEYLPGGTLAGLLRRGPLPDPDAIGLVRQVARSLARVHARGLYHGDIKPSNIGFMGDRSAKLLDFGLARALSLDRSDEPDGGARADRPPLGGTWAYLAPDVRDGAAPGPGLDLWALGVVFCEALTGSHPFPRARTAHDVTAGLSTALSRLRSERSPSHERVVAAMLAPHPGDRPATASAFERLLADL